MARLKNKKQMGIKTVIELTVDGSVYLSENGIIHHNCNECIRLHMLKDGVTPRVWKMSEMSMSWHKRGEDRPSCNGEHPFCRCSLSQLPPGWGFKNGFVSYIGEGYDEYKKQREET